MTQPLSDVAAEQALTGAMLLSVNAIDAALENNVTTTTFTDPNLALIFDATVDLHTQGEPADAITVSNLLTERGFLEQVGGNPRLVELQTGTPAISNAGSYARIIVGYQHDRHVVRQLHDACNGSFANWRGIVDELVVTADTWDAATDTEGFFVNMQAVMDGETFGDPPTIGQRSDGAVSLFYAGMLNNVFGESESGKSLLVQAVVVDELMAGNYVVFLDYEKDASSIAERLLQMGATREAIAERFLYQRREDDWSTADLAKLRAAVTQHKPTLAVIDGVTNAMTLERLEPLSNSDVSKFYAGVPALLAWGGAAVVAIDHIVKSREGRAPGAIGGQHKRAGITGASFELVMKDPAGRGRVGTGMLNIDKDAPGWLRTHAVNHKLIADITFDSDGENLTVRIDKSAQQELERTDAGLRMTGYMERVSKTLEAFGEQGATGRQVEASTTGRGAYVRDTLKVLVAEEHVTVERAGSSLVYRSVKPYRELADPTLNATSDPTRDRYGD